KGTVEGFRPCRPTVQRVARPEETARARHRLDRGAGIGSPSPILFTTRAPPRRSARRDRAILTLRLPEHQRHGAPRTVRIGARGGALAVVEESIVVSRRRGTRFGEFRALREIRGLQAKPEIEAALAEADAWLEMSNAKSYEPFPHVERAELARLV